LSRPPTREKFSHIRHLIVGINPKLDQALEEADKHISEFEKYFAGDIILLGVENQPEDTEEEKEAQKIIPAYFEQLAQSKKRSCACRKRAQCFTAVGEYGRQSLALGQNIWRCKGPLGIVTIVAAVIVVGLQTTSCISPSIIKVVALLSLRHRTDTTPRLLFADWADQER
jgi:hypothetical protein